VAFGAAAAFARLEINASEAGSGRLNVRATHRLQQAARYCDFRYCS
jgi:hypothetical protein